MTLKEIEEEPNIGQNDESKCLLSWIDTCLRDFNRGQGMILSHNATKALLHTLVANKVRVQRLIKERDNGI